jgi:hypothetical protein
MLRALPVESFPNVLPLRHIRRGVMAGTSVWSGDMTYTCSETWLTFFPAVKSIDATCQPAKKIP